MRNTWLNRSIQNPVKHLRWSVWQKTIVERSILDVWLGSEYAAAEYIVLYYFRTIVLYYVSQGYEYAATKFIKLQVQLF